MEEEKGNFNVKVKIQKAMEDKSVDTSTTQIINELGANTGLNDNANKIIQSLVKRQRKIKNGTRF